MSFISKVIEDKDSVDFLGHSDAILLLLIKGVHCLEKISALVVENRVTWGTF